ncbi:MAG: VWA domain-containing protein [Pirellulales bacterium]|nr:VWA domain-containing protein [Pirellulales bacterium]
MTGEFSAAKRTGLALWLCLLAMLVLCGGFTMSVLSRPARTPVLTLCAAYGPQWDLNAWVWEDLQRVESLGEGTFSVHSLPDIHSLAGGFWDDADRIFEAAFRSAPPDGPWVVYANLHGAVDDQGRACWIPPNVAVNDASSWFPIADLLDHLEHAQRPNQRRPLVLVLECGKLRSHWPAGIVNNDFDARLAELAAQHQRKYPNARLTILSSAAQGQRSLASRLGGGNVFTRYVVEALAGAADGAAVNQRSDGRIDVQELHRYVRSRTDTWARHHRGTTQTPTLHQAGVCGSAVDIVCVGSSTAAPEITPTPPPSPGQLERLHGVLAAVDQLRQEQPIRVNPYAWSQVQRTVDAIEQSVFGGTAARRTSDRWYNRLDRTMQNLRREIRMRDMEESQLVDSQLTQSALTVWSALAKQPTRRTATELLEALDVNQPMPVPMLHAIANRWGSTFWKHPELVRKTAKAQQQWLQCSRDIPDVLFPAAQQIAISVHRSRRRLADTVLAEAGGDDHEEIAAAVAEFEIQVQRDRELLMQLADASHTRDRALLELPYLYQWMEQTSAAQDLENQAASLDWDDLIELDQLLNQFASQATPWSPAFHDQLVVAAHQAASYLDRLRRWHDQTLQQTGNNQKDELGRVAGSLAGAIQCGLVASNPRDRVQARLRLRQLETDLSRTLPATKLRSAAGEDQAAASTGSRYLARLLDLDARLLGLDDGTLAAGGVRHRLQELAADQGDGQSWRRVVSLVIEEDFAAVVADSRQQAQRFRLACKAGEVLDDFWYAPPVNDVPYFASTGKLLLDSADSMLDESPRWRKRKRELSAMLQSHLHAASGGIVIEATSRPSYADQRLQRVSIAIDAPSGQSNLPAGTAVVAIEQQRGEALSHREVNIGEQKLERQEFDLTLASRRDVTTIAEVRFRGNIYQSTVAASDTAYGVTSPVPTAVPGAKITIDEAVEPRQALCFVLDCSASMNEAVEPEVVRGGSVKRKSTRLDAARFALLEMMHRLKSGGTEVGMVLYGHRMALGAGEDGLLLQQRYHKRFPFPPTLQPYEDVEVALPTGRFGTAELDLARQRFDAAVPWGQTPLFLAISTAIDDVSRLGGGVSKDVVVISDGRNYQFNPSPEADIALPAIIAKAKQHQVRVHIIGFGTEGDQAATTEFQQIAAGSGGRSCNQVSHAGELLGQLERFTVSERFSVQLEGETLSAKLGETIELPKVAGVNVPLSVQLGGQAVLMPISPGNHLRLLTDPMGGDPRCQAYKAGLPRFVPLVDDQQRPAAAALAVHHPNQVGGDLRCRLSMQHPEGQVVQRPAMVWAEVEAVGAGRRPRAKTPRRVYRTPDVAWLNDTTCPVAEFLCRRWPADADRYSVQAWCRADAPAGRTLTVTDDQQDYQPLQDIPGVGYRIVRTDQEIQLRLKYDPAALQSAGVDDSMLIVRMPSWSEGESTHWYDEAKGKSVHSFARPATQEVELGSALAEQPAGELVFWVCSIAEMKRGAVRMKQAIEGGLHTAVAHASATSYRFK